MVLAVIASTASVVSCHAAATQVAASRAPAARRRTQSIQTKTDKHPYTPASTCGRGAGGQPEAAARCMVPVQPDPRQRRPQHLPPRSVRLRRGLGARPLLPLPVI